MVDFSSNISREFSNFLVRKIRSAVLDLSVRRVLDVLSRLVSNDRSKT